MAEGSRIGRVFVEVAAKGITAVQKSLGAVKNGLTAVSVGAKGLGNAIKETEGRLGKFTSSFGALSSAATGAFAVASASITGLVRAADPRGFQKFEMVLARISVQLGSIFLPILDDVTALLDNLLEALRGLTDEQKDQIAHWVELGLAIGALFVIGSKLVSWLRIATIAFQVFGAVIGIATGGIVPLIGLVAALVGSFFLLSDGLGDVEDKAGGLAGIFEALQPALAKIGDVLAGLWERLQPAIEAFLEQLADFAGKLMDFIGGLLAALAPVLEDIANIFIDVLSTIIEFLGNFLDVFSGVFDSLKEIIVVFANIFKGAFGVFRYLVNALSAAFVALRPVIEDVFSLLATACKALQPIFETVFGIIKAVINAVIKSIIYLATLLKEVAKGNFLGAHGKAKEAVAEYERRLDEAESKAGRKIEGRERQVEKGGGLFGEGGPSFKDRAKDIGRDIGRGVTEKELELENRVRRRFGLPERQAGQRLFGGAKAGETRRHAPEALPYKPELLDVVGAWKKAVVSVAQTPEQAAREEQLRLQREGNKHLAKIAQNTEEDKEDGWGNIGGDKL